MASLSNSLKNIRRWACKWRNFNKKLSICWDIRSYYSLVQTSLLYDIATGYSPLLELTWTA